VPRRSTILLLPGCGFVEPAAHLGEPCIDVRPEVGQVLAHRVEHVRVLLPELADLRAHLVHVAVRAAGQHPRG
jgi:hypothetical protein